MKDIDKDSIGIVKSSILDQMKTTIVDLNTFNVHCLNKRVFMKKSH